jgi:L-alanine-DL-glutamate epimerase-like enolase superfamily enzyme
MRIVSVKSMVVELPFRRPFVVWRGEIPSKPHVFVALTTDTGVTGWGEAAPFLFYAPETAHDIDAFIRYAMRDELLGQDPRDVRRLMDTFAMFDGHLMAKAAIETALWDILGQAAGLPLYRLLGGAVREAVPLTIVLHSDEPSHMAEEAADWVAQGFTSLKIKIGFGPERDVARVAAVRERIGPGPLIRVDAEEHYDVKESLALARRLEPFAIELISQPVARDNWDGMRYLRERLPMPLLADEGIHSPADIVQAVRTGAADQVNIKVLKSGGLLASQEMAAIARGYHLPVMIGSMIESGIGSAFAAHLALALPNVFSTELCGPLLFASDALTEPLRIAEGSIWLNPDAPGLGVTPDLAYLEAHQAASA